MLYVCFPYALPMFYLSFTYALAELLQARGASTQLCVRASARSKDCIRYVYFTYFTYTLLMLYSLMLYSCLTDLLQALFETASARSKTATVLGRLTRAACSEAYRLREQYEAGIFFFPPQKKMLRHTRAACSEAYGLREQYEADIKKKWRSAAGTYALLMLCYACFRMLYLCFTTLKQAERCGRSRCWSVCSRPMCSRMSTCCGWYFLCSMAVL